MKSSDISALETSVQEGLELLRKSDLPDQARFALAFLAPEGMTPVIELYADHHHKLVPPDAWNPEIGEVHVSFRASISSQPSTSFATEKEAPAETISTQLPPLRFQPIAVRGEPVSATLLRDRGRT